MPFEFGAYGPLRVRAERVAIPLPAPLRLLYASDLHLGHRWTASVPDRLLEAARSARPDLILLGGDLADNPRALPDLRRTVAGLSAVAPVGAIAGNHDARAGLRDVRLAVRVAVGRWLAEDPFETPVRIDGAIRPSDGGPRILCTHDPALFPAAVAAGYDLVLAGHLHGGQCVLFERGGKQYPAAWFNRWHGERFADGRATMLVSRGAADTFPLRFRCPREVILCALGPAEADLSLAPPVLQSVSIRRRAGSVSPEGPKRQMSASSLAAVAARLHSMTVACSAMGIRLAAG